VSAADRALAHQPPGGVLYLPAFEPGALSGPISNFLQAENVYGTTAHHRATPNGYSGFFPPSWYRLSKEMRALPDTAALDRLRALGVSYVVVRSWARHGLWDELLHPAQAAPLRLLGTYGGDLLYEVPPAPSR